ncbi:MAG: DUF1735 domain-containing protein [Bacteroidetes bacterium]|nr:DUF1735 domain-containing protein [Bacteroidota bacterium]
MKKTYIIFSVVAGLALPGCLKDKANTDVGNQDGYIAEISTSSVNSTDQAPSGGLTYFGDATMATSVDPGPDNEFFTVNIASPFPPVKDIPVTIAVDDAKRTAYNATTPDYVYSALPANAYSLPATTGTVHSGLRLDTFNITFMYGNMDPTKDYMLPISITQAPGTTISGNMSTIYFHVVGNLLAVNHTQAYTIYSGKDSTGAVSGGAVLGPVLLTPLSPLKNEFMSGFSDAQTTKLRYDLSFVRSGGVAGTFSVAFNSSDVKAMQKAGDSVKVGPSLIAADFANGTYRLGYQVKVKDGSYRYVIDNFQR